MTRNDIGSKHIFTKDSDGQLGHADRVFVQNATDVRGSQSAFGEQLVVTLTPSVNIYFPYNLNSGILSLESNGSAILSQESGMARISTGTTTLSSGNIESLRTVRYTPGQGVNIRMSALFTSGADSNARQYGGIGTEVDGFFMGVSGTTFGIFHRSFGGETFIPSTDFNGTIISNFNWIKGNVYNIQYQFLGFGDITFGIEDPITGNFRTSHTIRYTNANDKPSVSNPSMHLRLEVTNGDGTDNVILKSASVGAFLEGPSQGQTLHFAASGSQTLSTDGPFNVLTLRNNTKFAGVPNHSQVVPQFLSISNDGVKDALVEVVSNVLLTSSSFQDIDGTRSIVSVDQVGTSPVVSSGNLRGSFLISKNDSLQIDLSQFELAIHEGQTVSIIARRIGGATNINASILWKEEF